MIATNIESPTFYPHDFVLDAVISPTLRGIDITASGLLEVEDINGTVRAYDFQSLSLPYRLVAQIRKITSTTNIGLESLIGLV